MSGILTMQMVLEVIADTLILEGRSAPPDMEQINKKYLESLEIVNDRGERLGEAPRGLAHRLGLRHSVVYCVIYDAARARLLLQTRGSGRLDISVGGHVQAGEASYETALAREFEEEIGMRADPSRLRPVGVYNRDAEVKPDKPLERNRERRHVYSYTLTAAEEAALASQFDTRIEQKEVLGWGWFTLAAVQEAVKEGRCADGLRGSVPLLIQEASTPHDSDVPRA